MNIPMPIIAYGGRAGKKKGDDRFIAITSEKM
jgi:hypothetical protein